jgi:hypothetical protein
MNSATSTKGAAASRGAAQDSGFKPWNFYVLAAMLAASAGVMMSQHTHPVALVLLSITIFCAGLVGVAAHRAISAFLSKGLEVEPASPRSTETLLKDKYNALQRIKELEFDHSMGKISDRDFQILMAPLRARALELLRDIERNRGGYREQIERDVRERLGPSAPPLAKACADCGTHNEPDARFCKECGRALAS